MRILELLRIFRVIADLPDFGDKEAVRAWLLKLCDVAKLLTDRTPTPADDAVLAFLERSIAEPKLFDPFHALVVRLLDSDPDLPCAAEDVPAALAAEAEAAAIDPLTIIAIVKTVLDLLRGFGLIKRS